MTTIQSHSLQRLSQDVTARVTTNRDVAQEFIQEHLVNGRPALSVNGIERHLRFRVNELGLAELWTESREYVP